MRNLQLGSLVLAISVMSASAFATGEGAGVRGGGGVQCRDGEAHTLESYGLDPSFEKLRFLDVDTVTERYLSTIGKVNPTIASAIRTELNDFHSVENWQTLPSRNTDSELLRLSRSLIFAISVNIFNDEATGSIPQKKNLRAWDEKLSIPLRPGCKFIQLSVLMDGKPQIFSDALALLDPLERKILEIHEASYSVMIRHFEHTNPILVREMIIEAFKLIIDENTSLVELSKKIELSIEFKENRQSYLMTWPDYARKTLSRSNVISDYRETRRSHSTVVSIDENRFCPLAVTFDFDGNDGLLLSSHYVQKDQRIPENQTSPLKSFTVKLSHSADLKTGPVTVRRMHASNIFYVSRTENDGSKTDTIYSFEVGKMTAVVLDEKIIKRPNTMTQKQLQKLFNESITRCEFKARLPQADDTLLWSRIFGELEW